LWNKLEEIQKEYEKALGIERSKLILPKKGVKQ